MSTVNQSHKARSVKVYITNRQKDVKIPTGVRLLIRRCCNAALAHENFPYDAEVSVSFVNNEQIHELNAQYRNVDAPTDVLSFPLGENNEYDRNEETGAMMLGDIVISVPKAMEQARLYGHTLQRELGFLTVHSMLHLLGYDHERSAQEEQAMFALQDSIMEQLGLPR